MLLSAFPRHRRARTGGVRAAPGPLRCCGLGSTAGSRTEGGLFGAGNMQRVLKEGEAACVNLTVWRQACRGAPVCCSTAVNETTRRIESLGRVEREAGRADESPFGTPSAILTTLFAIRSMKGVVRLMPLPRIQKWANV